eukprot:7641477-Alexandrium_andersonii.AAC.1
MEVGGRHALDVGQVGLPRGNHEQRGSWRIGEADPAEASDPIPEQGSALDRSLEHKLPDRSRGQRVG